MTVVIGPAGAFGRCVTAAIARPILSRYLIGWRNCLPDNVHLQARHLYCSLSG